MSGDETTAGYHALSTTLVYVYYYGYVYIRECMPIHAKSAKVTITIQARRQGGFEGVHGGLKRNARVSYLRRYDERTRVNAWVNKSLLHALESCPSIVMSPH